MQHRGQEVEREGHSQNRCGVVPSRPYVCMYVAHRSFAVRGGQSGANLVDNSLAAADHPALAGLQDELFVIKPSHHPSRLPFQGVGERDTHVRHDESNQERYMCRYVCMWFHFIQSQTWDAYLSKVV